MSVTARHPEYEKHLDDWRLVRDVVNSNVKKYIIDIDKSDPDRCARYKEDACLTNFTSRTKNGLVGAAIRKDPQVDLPSYLEYLIEDATGNRMSLNRLNKEAIGEVLQAGRFGLLSDYPASQEGLTAAEVEELNYKARIYRYPAESIVNWTESIINGQTTLTMVNLREFVNEVGQDGFTWVEKTQYRVLRLEEGKCVQYLFNQEGQIIESYIPRQQNGQPWSFIPFSFVGSEDNDAVVDYSPLKDLAVLNIGHYRNSADYEESVHVTGQPTLMISSNMSAEEFNAANPGGVLIGARRGHNLGAGGNAFMLQAQPNSLAYEAMKLKQEQAVMIGARLVMQASSNETAEAARIKHSGENSVLSTIVQNVAEAIEQNIRWCAMFMASTGETDELEFEPNLEFFDQTLDPNLLMAQFQLYNNGIIAKSDIRNTLRKVGIIGADRTDEDIDSDVDMLNPMENTSWMAPPVQDEVE